MSTVAIASPWIIMIALGGLGSLTAVGAPLPLDPVLSQIAPEQCLWYSATAGAGAPDPTSSNHTEQLFAEPQVQRFLVELETQITSALRRAGGPAREQRVITAEGPKLVKILLSRPMAMYVEEVKPAPDGGVQVAAAIVLSAGDQKTVFRDSLGQLLSLATAKGLKLTTETGGGIDWQRIELPRAAPAVRFGWKDNYFIVAVGQDTPTTVLERMGGATPKWLTELRAEHPVEREMTIGYIDVAGILERARPLVEAKDPQAWPIIERLGLTSIKAVHAVGGYDATGCVSMVHLATDGTRPGLLQFIPHKPLMQEDLAIVPKDALVALAVSLDPAEATDQAVALVSQFEPRAREDFERTMWEIEAHVGVNVRDEVLATVGDAWVVYLPGGDLMSSWLNSAAAVRVKDPARLRT
ncbi:MAG TPA: hypothetical protein VEQ85_13775, partial [Lacipirellulaceae bacterium]|nr:hypothetical protein [Lacipirellulaceae bacterium]